MSVLSNLFNKNRNIKTVFTDEKTAKDRMWAAINMPSIHFDADDGKKIASMVICSKIISQDTGRLPIKLFKTDDNGNKIVVKDDYRYILLHHHPNAYTDSYTFWSTVEFIRSYTGNSYVKINRDSSGIASFTVLNSDDVSGPVVIDNKLYYGIKGYDEPVNSIEILHFRNLSSDGLKGRDPKEDLNLNLSISFKALTTLDSFFTNGAMGTLVLETLFPEGVNPEDWAEQKEKFKEEYGGYLNSHNIFVPPPYTKLNPIRIDFASSQLMESIKYNNGQVACYYGVPPHKVGIIENSKFNSLVELQSDYITNTIAPILTMYRRELELKLLSDEELLDGYSIEFETKALNITDSKTRIDEYVKLFGVGAVKSNEIRKWENLPAYEGGDNTFIGTGYMGLDKATGKIPTQSANNPIQ